MVVARARPSRMHPRLTPGSDQVRTFPRMRPRYGQSPQLSPQFWISEVLIQAEPKL